MNDNNNIIDLSDKRRQAERTPKAQSIEIIQREAKPLVIVCHCTSPLFELLSGGKIECSRCGCALPASWRFES